MNNGAVVRRRNRRFHFSVHRLVIRIISLGLLLSLGRAVLWAQSTEPNILSTPTGPFGIGRMTYHWTDSSRAEFLSTDVQARREVMVDVWYPAQRLKETLGAPYLPDLPRLQRVLGDSALRREFAPASAAIAAGRLRTHAAEGALPSCPPRRCPLLIFSHGGGVDRSFYTSQYEDLASHGYMVAVIAHTYDTHLVVFPDGRVVRAAPAFRDTLRSDSTLPRWRRNWETELRSQAYVRRVIDVAAKDIRFVIDQLSRYARDVRQRTPLLHRIDLGRIGAFGHSAGGEAAAFACQVDARLKACLDQDGVMRNLPFSRDAGGRTMSQPFMYMGRRYRPPRLSDHDLASMEMTRAEADSLLHAMATGQDELLSDMPSGAYRVTLKMPRVMHMSFSDEPLVEAARDSMKTADARVALTTIEKYTRAFFDKTLLGRTQTVLDRPLPADTALVTVEQFAPTVPRTRR
jgi:platelet-activating factor acetylhydrolase isoform II